MMMTTLFCALLAATTYVKVPFARDAPVPHPYGCQPRTVTVVVDPGHGGPMTGAFSHSGRPEKDFDLLLSFDIRAALTNLGYRVVMTREDDRDVGLPERPAVAIVNDASAFISVHFNAPPPGGDPLKTRYQSVYYWNDIGKALASAVGARIPCEAIHANFLVMRNPEVPSCLLEADFITHPDGEKAAADPAWRRRYAECVAEGFRDWATKPPAKESRKK